MNISQPKILILTSTMLRHSAILRPNDKGYFTQEDIDTKFERSIAAAKYLRQELGITEKNDDLENFISKLEESIPLHEQMKKDYESIPKEKYNYAKKYHCDKNYRKKKSKECH